MRYVCYFCGKSVSSELPDDAVIRAALVCPECIEDGQVALLGAESDDIAEQVVLTKKTKKTKRA